MPKQAIDAQSVLCVLILLTSVSVEGSNDDIKLENNGYTGVVVAIDPNVKEDASFIDNIKEFLIGASSSLYTATRYRAFLKDVTIVVPKGWESGTYEEDKTKTRANSDVIIREKRANETDTPFVITSGGCGDYGRRMHLTTEFVRGGNDIVCRYGAIEKVFVHEWGHYRWGLFDEYPIPKEGFPRFYADKQSIEGTRCPKALTGDKIPSDGAAKCKYNEATLLPEDSCHFVPHDIQTNNLNTSMMADISYVPQIAEFCHNDINDEVNLHNKDAPNKHNHLCDKKSTWEVIMESTDFDNKNHPNHSLDTKPTFKVVRGGSEIFVLVLDVSGSMVGEKLLAMRQVADSYIRNYAGYGNYVGLVKFSWSAIISSNLLEINPSNINTLTSLLPNAAGGGTSIGDGISKGISVIQSPRSTIGANLVVLTDGEENAAPYISDVSTALRNSQVKLHTLFFGTDKNPILEQLSEESGGQWFYTAENDPTSLSATFFTISQAAEGVTGRNQVLIYNTAITVNPSVEVDDTVKIDSSIGINTVFTFSWNFGNNPLKIRIWNPQQNCFYASYVDSLLSLCSDNTTYEVSEDIKTIRFNIGGKAEAGNWRFVILSSSNVIVTSSVTSQTTGEDDEDPIEIETWNAVAKVDNAPAVVYVRVSKGVRAVVNAEVEAEISDPNGNKRILQMNDNGKDYDTTKDDGIYAASFFSYKVTGRFSITITAQNGQVYTMITSASLTCKLNFNNEEKLEYLDTYKRILVGGGLEIKRVATSDTIPPGKVNDLFVMQVDLRDYILGINVTFSAPGDDAYIGKASRYELRYIIGNTTLNFTNNGGTLVTTVLEGNLTSPKESGSEESFVILLNEADISPDDRSLKVHFNVRAVDSSGLYSEPSNIASMRYFLSEDDLPVLPIETTTAEPTTTPEPTTTKPKRKRKQHRWAYVFVAILIVFAIIGATWFARMFA